MYCVTGERTNGLALTARRGCYGDNHPRAYTHPPTSRRTALLSLPPSPSPPSAAAAAWSTTKSVTPTFQVDDLHCIVDARARDRPHLDRDNPSRSGGGSRARMQAVGRRRRGGLKRTVGCHNLRLKIVWLVTVNFRGRHSWGCVSIALSGARSFFLSPSAKAKEGGRLGILLSRHRYCDG